MDDELATQVLLKSTLDEAGYETATTFNAEEALACVADFDPSIAIVDIRLPGGMDGLELCHQLRQKHGVDVVVITGFSSEHGYVEAADSGASDFIVKPIHMEELLLRCQRVIDARHTRQARDRSMRELRRLAVTDTLTGLYTSGHLFKQLKAEVGRSQRYSRTVSICMLDVDSFKSINDTYGHQEGDRALVFLANTIRAVMRESDDAYRYGGEEFVLVLPETDGAAALLVAERLRAAVQASDVVTDSGAQFRLSISIGVAQCESEEDDKSLLKRADMAMYEAKGMGRNQVFLAPTVDRVE